MDYTPHTVQFSLVPHGLGTRLSTVALQPKYVIGTHQFVCLFVCLFSFMVFLVVSFVVGWVYPPEMNVVHSADLSLATGELKWSNKHAPKLEVDDTLRNLV